MTSKWHAHKASAEQARAQGDLAGAERAWLAALEEAEDAGAQGKRLGRTLESLSEILFLEGKYALAAAVCRRLMHLYEQSAGGRREDVGVIANNLAMLYHTWKKFEEAEVFYMKALEIKKSTLGPDHPDVAVLETNYLAMMQEQKNARTLLLTRHFKQAGQSGSSEAANAQGQ